MADPARPRRVPRAAADAAYGTGVACNPMHRPRVPDNVVAMPMRVMLVDDDLARRGVLEQALCCQGHSVIARLDTGADLLLEVRRHRPDVILIEVDAPGRDTLESLDRIHRDVPRPIVMFSGDGDPESIRRAVRAGVSAYVVDGLDVNRLRSIIDVAIARFDEFHSLRRELDDTRARLADRQDVEKAKGLLMKRRGLGEDAAYALLRKVAMDRSLRLGEAARIVIAAAEIL